VTWIIDAVIVVYVLSIGVHMFNMQRHFERVCGEALQSIDWLEGLNEKLEARVRELEDRMTNNEQR